MKDTNKIKAMTKEEMAKAFEMQNAGVKQHIIAANLNVRVCTMRSCMRRARENGFAAWESK